MDANFLNLVTTTKLSLMTKYMSFIGVIWCPAVLVIFMNVYFGPIVPFVVVLIVVVGVVVDFGFLVTFLRVWSLSGRRHSISPKVFDPLCHGRWQFFHLSNNIIVTSALYKCQTYNLISSTRLSNNALQWSFKGGRITKPSESNFISDIFGNFHILADVQSFHHQNVINP